MAATQNRDMGSGSIPKLLAQLALPAVVAQVVNLLYNIVDRIYIGHMPEVGASALTGVGLFTPILMLITAFAMLCGSGGAPRAAIAMVFAITAMMMKITRYDTMRIATTMASVIATASTPSAPVWRPIRPLPGCSTASPCPSSCRAPR
mgnify:CR=1 FL=1